MPDRLRARVGWWLRRLADRIDDRHAPRHPGLSFTIETGKGLVIHEDGRGCPLWYLGEDDHARAYNEADGGDRAALIAAQFMAVNDRPARLRGTKGGYTAGNVTVAEMGPLPDALARAALGFVETHANPDLLNWRDTPAGRRERARWEAQRDAARCYGGQHSPWGVTRPPLVTARQETPPPARYVPE